MSYEFRVISRYPRLAPPNNADGCVRVVIIKNSTSIFRGLVWY